MKRLFSLFLGLALSLSGYEAKNYQSLLKIEGFSEEAMKIHIALYEGYVKNATLLSKQLEEMARKGEGSSYSFGALKRRFAWEFDGMRLHELYFDQFIGGAGKISAQDLPVIQAIKKQFGSVEEWKRSFIATGMMRGIGWAVLYYDPETKSLINCWINEHDVGHLAGGKPLLVMDVFEHAYMLQYGLDRVAYIQAFFSHLNWDIVCARFCKAVGDKN